MRLNCMSEQGIVPEWEKYCHFYVMPNHIVGSQSETIDLEEAVTNPDRVTVWAIYGLRSDGDVDLVHDAKTVDEADGVVLYCLRCLNKARSHKIIANEVLQHFKFSAGEFKLDEYDDIESSPVKFYPEIPGYEQCQPDDNPSMWSLYAHVKDEAIGGVYNIHDCATESEMKQLDWILLELIRRN